MLNKNIIIAFAFLLIIVNGLAQELKLNEVIYGGKQLYFIPGQPSPTRLGSGKKIYKRNIITENTEIIYSGTVNQHLVKLSPDRKHIGSIQYGIGGEYRGYPQAINNLIILNTDGNLVHEINDNVRRFSWSPDGKKIAYITGEYQESKAYKVTGYYIFDIANGEKTQIEGIGIELKWAEFDNSIYFDGWKRISERRAIPMMYKLDLRNNKLEETKYNGINFSPNGSYYVAKNGEGDQKLFNTRTNKNIKVKGLDLARPKYEWLGKDQLIITGSDSTVIGWPKHTILYNTDQRIILRKSSGTPIVKYSRNGIHKVVMQNEIHIIEGNQIETIQKTWSDR